MYFFQQVKTAMDAVHPRIQAAFRPLKSFIPDFFNDLPSALLIMFPLLWASLLAQAPVYAVLSVCVLGILLRWIAEELPEQANALKTKTSDEKAKNEILLKGALALAAGVLAWAISPLVFLFLLFWAGMVWVIPTVRQHFWWWQLYAAFIYGAWAVVMGIAAGENISWFIFPLVIVGFLWACLIEITRAGFHVKEDMDDCVKSIALWLGENHETFLQYLVAAFAAFVLLTGLTMGAGGLFYIVLMASQFWVLNTYFGATTKTRVKKTYTLFVPVAALLALAFWVA